MNEIVNLALTDETLEGRKLILNGKDNVSFLDINNLIRQSKFAEDNYIYLYKDRKRLVHRALQLFFHGNNHFVNMVFIYLSRKLFLIITTIIVLISTTMIILLKN